MDSGGLLMEETERPILGVDDPLPESEDAVLALFDTHCLTEGCPNGGFTLRVPAAAVNPLVTCGACGNPITDCVAVE